MITGGSMIGYKIDLDELEVVKDFSGDFMLLDSFAKLSDNEVLFAHFNPPHILCGRYPLRSHKISPRKDIRSSFPASLRHTMTNAFPVP